MSMPQFTLKMIHFAAVFVSFLYPINRCFCFAKKEQGHQSNRKAEPKMGLLSPAKCKISAIININHGKNGRDVDNSKI